VGIALGDTLWTVSGVFMSEGAMLLWEQGASSAVLKVTVMRTP